MSPLSACLSRCLRFQSARFSSRESVLRDWASSVLRAGEASFWLAAFAFGRGFDCLSLRAGPFEPCSLASVGEKFVARGDTSSWFEPAA